MMKRILSFLLLFLMLFSLTTYAATDEDRIPDYLRIYIDGDSVKEGKEIDLMQKSTLKLTAKTFPSTASNGVKWYSSDEDIATVSSSGVITALEEGQCKIYARSSVKSSRKTYITLNVTEYIRYPDKVTLEMEKDAVLETGNTVKFNVKYYPEDTTEKRLHWMIIGGNASVNQDGEVTIQNKGKVTVRIYSDDLKCSDEYTFDAKYRENHFEQIGECFNVSANRGIIFTFDENVNIQSAVNNIFSSVSAEGNGALMDVYVTVNEKTITVTPKLGWNKGENYVFIRENVMDINGVKLNKNIKYKVNAR